LLSDPVDCGAWQGKLGWFHGKLELERMREAARELLGEHDFSAFRAAECQAKSPVKHVHEAAIEQRGGVLDFRFRADAFLHHMVRNLVGELVYVGAGRHSLDEFREILLSRDRTRAAPTFAPDGLYFADIEYDAAFGIPQRRARFPWFG
jgi:tRNA pseudouridine38-40 synthase